MLCAHIHVSLALIMMDAASVFQLMREWNQLYHDLSTALPPFELSYRDYVLWNEQLVETPQYQQARDYWLARLDSLPPAPKLPARRSATQPDRKVEFVRHVLKLDMTQWQQLQQRAQQAGITPTALLLTAFAEVLALWSEQPQFTLNCTFFNRLPGLHPQLNRILGDFTSVTLLQVDTADKRTLLDQVKQVNRQLWQDLEQRTFNGIRVIQELTSRQQNQAGALMPVVFTSLLGINTTLGIDVKATQAKTFLDGQVIYSISQTPQVSLDYQVSENGEGLLIVWDAVDGFYPEGLIDEMFETHAQWLQYMIADDALWATSSPATPTLGSLRRNFFPPVQRQLLDQINDTAGDYPNATLSSLFLNHVYARPNAPAVITVVRTFTYQELYDCANAVGHWLQARNGGKPLAADTLVAVVMEKGWEQIAAVFGILLAGGAYVPIDPGLPRTRRDYLLEQSEVTLVLTQAKLEATLTWPAQIPASQRLSVDTQATPANLPVLTNHHDPAALAYVLYTSGSTGTPKGVMIEQRSVINRMSDIAERFGLTADDRAIALTALHHDLSVFDLFGMLSIVGGAIVLPNADRIRDPGHWAEIMARHQVTLWNSVPAFLQMLVEQLEYITPARLPAPLALRWVILSGDFIPVPLPDRLRTLQPKVEIIASGGPTETTVWDIYYRVGAVDPKWPSIPYGKPLKNAHYYIMNDQLQECPLWTPGEMCIGGVGLARGYWKDAEKTQAKFVIHPQTGERLYRSGDLGRFLPDGNLEILGRTDFQVKIRGQRIELGEIEAHLRHHPLIKEAVVTTVNDANQQRQLAAYVVLTNGAPAQTDANKAPALHQAREAVPLEFLQDITLLDPLERLAFKLEKRGIRRFDPPHTNGMNGNGVNGHGAHNGLHDGLKAAIPQLGAVNLPKPVIDEAFQAPYLSRQSYRRFVDETIELDTLSQFLTCLMPIQLPNAPLLKYRYPSASGLYPIQAYLYLKEGRVAGLAKGFYYYHPLQHQLILLSTDDRTVHHLFPDANQAIFDEAAFALWLIADMAAIAPMYGQLARDFALLEVGYISQLLMMEGSHHRLGFCPIGGVDGPTMQRVLALGDSHQILHCLAGGRLAPQQLTQWLQESDQSSSMADSQSDWQMQIQTDLGEKLPAHMVPTAYVALDALPLTANGKVDRKALPAPDLRTAPEPFVAPESNLEKAITNVLQEMLTIGEVGIDHNFAELGLNSVHMVRFNNRLSEALHQQISIAALFQHSTVRMLAQYLSQSEQQAVVQQTEQAVVTSRSEQRAQARLAGRQQQRR
ncbi:MAG: amino acid adenylation domain-containing protein [Caldilineaceae bacterium]